MDAIRKFTQKLQVPFFPILLAGLLIFPFNVPILGTLWWIYMGVLFLLVGIDTIWYVDKLSKEFDPLLNLESLKEVISKNGGSWLN